MRPFLFSALAALAGAFALPAPAAPAAPTAPGLTFESGPAAVTLLELFTSEGCSSCPPAERRFAALRDEPGLWRDFVPVVFHVDYWNRLGWPDRYSQTGFTRRESAYAAAWGSSSVYTPCIVRDGREHRGPLALAAAGRPAAGRLHATFDRRAVQADFTPAASSPPGAASTAWEIHAALLGGGIVSRVTAGENRGATLRHEFVVLALVDGAPGMPLAFPPDDLPDAPRYALAVWVTARGELTPVQATGGWID